MEQIKQGQKRNQPRVSRMKQFTAVVAALTMTAFMGLCIFAIGASAYLSGRGVG